MTIAAAKSGQPLLSEAEFIAGFHAIGEERYHHKHPFHLLMHEGKLTRASLQAWALQSLLLPEPHPHQRRRDSGAQRRSRVPLAWRKRILDHDGDGTKNPAASKNGYALVEATAFTRASAKWRRHTPRHALRRFRLTSISFPRARTSKP